MAEANPQASSLVDISSDVIANTVSQVTYGQDVVEQVFTQPQGNTEVQQQSVSTHSDPVSVMLKTLEGMAKKIDNFEKQAQADRDRLCEQFKNDSSKKSKTPKKNVNKKMTMLLILLMLMKQFSQVLGRWVRVLALCNLSRPSQPAVSQRTTVNQCY